MVEQEFYNLLCKWTNTPEYKEYRNLCISNNTLPGQADNSAEVASAFKKAMSNKYGKQLANTEVFETFFKIYTMMK